MPTQSDSNFFWMSFLVFIILWVITFFVTLLTSGISRAIIPALSIILHSLNFMMFMRAHRAAKTLRDLLARQQVEEVEGITFELVRDEPQADTLKPSEEEEDKSEVV
jgi:multisubunit Na+/H+ antiporter MnhC subunit